MEYILNPAQEPYPPIFLFVVDVSLIDEELCEVKDSLQQALSLLPEEALVGLITFGKMAHVHELSFQECPKSYVFRGNKAFTPQELQDQLGFTARHDPRGAQGSSSSKRFLLPISECEFALNSILDDLQRDPWTPKPGERSMKSVGTALSVAVSLLEASYSGQGARIMLFLGGAATQGPGQIVSEKFSEFIRSHLDIQKDNAKYYKAAVKFYQGLAQRASAAGHIIDIFACCLDQVGLLEMKPCVENTGGYLVMSESFNTPMFKESLRKIFDRDEADALKMGFNANIEIIPSRDIKVSGAIGPCLAVPKKSNHVSETTIGQSGTTTWKIGGVDKNSSIAFYFDMANPNNQVYPPGKQAFIQFKTVYQHSTGQLHLRVTTMSRRFAEQNTMVELAQSFDQEAAAVLMARYSIQRSESEDTIDVIRWLDRMLIRLVSKFAEYSKGDPNTFRLPREFSLYPGFMYHLRRSSFLQTFNASPDESTYYRTLLLRENISNTLVMIQPALMQYSLNDEEPVPVLLDINSMKNDVILMLDTFFKIIVWYGEEIISWRDQGYQELPEYEHFAQMLEMPKEDADTVVAERYPAPQVIYCKKVSDPNERYFKAKVNPNSGNTAGNAIVESGNNFNDDVSMQVFMQHLIRLTVDS
eukprot:CAMPEP_0115036662 /NCGR_PEP_ID=MMETSP0216-20121206/42260_1 /TAXON_ID=223996 /ORGANISM="Protocruzia adherens, Strain Boccale" /LENGTH=642 /DNA_ID=CAMNT_0002416541 /DNA_START=359 /DNA_END=2287 /DNA_ORIENTATION=+